MINTATETLVSLTEAAALLPRRRAGKKPNVCTIYRWTSDGCRGVVLESCQIGGTRCTSREALARFFGALTAQAGVSPVTTIRTAAARERASDRAARELERAGI